jgi:hypothetical protein
MKKFKEAAVALLTFKPYTSLNRKVEIGLGIFAWLQILNVVRGVYLLISQ